MTDMTAITIKLMDVDGRDVYAEIIDAFMSRAAHPERLESLVDELWDLAVEIGEDYADLVDWLEFRGYL